MPRHIWSRPISCRASTSARENSDEPSQHWRRQYSDGVRGTTDIIAETALPRYFVDRSLADLVTRAYIVRMGLGELMTTGDRLMKEERTKDGIRLAFANQAGVADELRAHAAVENECCAWAAWEAKLEDDELWLDARSTGAGVTTLHVMFADDDAATVPDDHR